MNDRPLMPNPDWTKLPLFDRKGWKRLPFGAFAQSVNERVEPSADKYDARQSGADCGGTGVAGCGA